MRSTHAALAGVITAGTLAVTAPGALATETLVGASNQNPAAPELSLFDSGKPGSAKRLQVVGQAAGDRVLGLDVRPATGVLYAKGMSGGTSQNYVVQLNLDDKPAGYDGKAIFSPIGARYGTSGAGFGYDFNPVVDRIRVNSTAQQNLRVNPDTGAALVDGPLKYAAGDRNAGKDPDVAGAGYIPAPFGGMTVLYDIDVAQDVLTVQAPPNDGTLNTRGSLGVKVTTKLGFDITSGRRGAYGGGSWYGGSRGSSDVRAYAAMQPEDRFGSRLYRIDLASGRASSIGSIGGGQPVEALAILGERDSGGYSSRR